MSEQKVVFSKLFKEGLSSKKIDLSLTDDIKKTAAKYQPIFAKANSDYMSALQGFKDALSVLEQTEDLAKKGQAQVKELGLNDDFFSKVLEDLSQQKNRVQAGINKLK